MARSPDEQRAPSGVEPASAARRLAGWLADVLLLAVLLPPLDAFLRRQGSSAVVSTVLVAVVAGLYVVVPTASVGRTLGMLAVRTRVTLAAAPGPVGLGRASTRWLALGGPVLVLPGLPPAVGAAALAWTAVVTWPVWRTDDHRGWHDRVAGTRVQHEPRVTPRDPLDR